MKKHSTWLPIVIGCQLLTPAVHAVFTLVDEVCLVIEGESPVLRRQIQARAEQKEISFIDAQNELKREKLMWVYAKKQPKYNVADISKQAEDHIKKIMESNKLTKEKFAAALMGPPYFTSLSQYQSDIATAMLENLIKSSMVAQISISDTEIKEELSKYKLEQKNSFDIVFVSVTADTMSNKTNDIKSVNSKVTAQFKKANEIRSHLKPQTSLNEIKTRYGGDKNISIIGPIAYEKGALKKEYDDRLIADSSKMVTEPFRDDGSVTLIWKIKKSARENLDEDALLEKVRKKLYEAAVERQFNSVTSAVMDGSTAIVKGCKNGR